MSRKQFTSNRERFKTLAENRTNAILNQIRILSHCSNKNLYEYEQEEIERIFKAVEDALAEAKSKFKDKKRRAFKL